MQYTKLKDLLPVLQKKIRIKFKNSELLSQAFVHKSYLNEHKGEVHADNERLEFLGDAVLELVTTEFLFSKFTKSEEGQLTSFRSALVKGKHLAEISKKLGLGNYLLLSRGEEKSGGCEKSYLLANTLEALIGAIYLDKGFKSAHKFISRHILAGLGEILKKGLHVDAKSHLQEMAQEKKGLTPSYKVLKEEGPDHNKVFEVGAYLGEELIGKGQGSSKQKAEQSAAQNALKTGKWN